MSPLEILDRVIGFILKGLCVLGLGAGIVSMISREGGL